MGRGGHRYGAGRPGWHLKAEHCLRLDVASMARRKLLGGGTFTWRWSNTYSGEEVGSINLRVAGDLIRLSYAIDGVATTQNVYVSHTPCNYGGTRPWLNCPQCHQRIGVLFLRGGAFGCRKCANVRYTSQSEDWLGRVWRLQAKLEAKLGADWARPKGMHSTTRARLLERIWNCEEARDAALCDFLEWHTAFPSGRRRKSGPRAGPVQ